MTNRDELLALAERCEAATGPDRNLDEAIARSVNWCPPKVNAASWEAHRDAKPNYWFTDSFGMPAYTASLDAAMTLVANENTWSVTTCGHEGLPRACVTLCAEDYAVDHVADAVTPALALTAACLRARADMEATPNDGL